MSEQISIKWIPRQNKHIGNIQSFSNIWNSMKLFTMHVSEVPERNDIKK